MFCTTTIKESRNDEKVMVLKCHAPLLYYLVSHYIMFLASCRITVDLLVSFIKANEIRNFNEELNVTYLTAFKSGRCSGQRAAFNAERHGIESVSGWMLFPTSSRNLGPSNTSGFGLTSSVGEVKAV